MRFYLRKKNPKQTQTRKSTNLIIFIWLKWWYLTEGVDIACRGWDWTASSGPYTHTISSPSDTLSSKQQSLISRVCHSSCLLVFVHAVPSQHGSMSVRTLAFHSRPLFWRFQAAGIKSHFCWGSFHSCTPSLSVQWSLKVFQVFF